MYIYFWIPFRALRFRWLGRPIDGVEGTLLTLAFLRCTKFKKELHAPSPIRLLLLLYLKTEQGTAADAAAAAPGAAGNGDGKAE